MKLARTLLLVFVLCSNAWAVVPAIPGDGIAEAETGTYGSCGAGKANAIANLAGTLATGCDLLSAAPDQDRDGYTSNGSMGTSGTTYIDPDDTDRTIYPGQIIKGGCSGSNYKICPASGGACGGCQTGPLAEGARNFYIHGTDGNDANAGTYAAPFKSLAKVSGGAGFAVAGLPASPVTLQANDYVYVIGGIVNTTFTQTDGGTPNIPILFCPGASGTSGNPIVVKQYPGTTGALVQANGLAINLADKNFITIDGIQGSSAWTSLVHAGSFISARGASDIVVKNIYATALLHGDYNGACIKFEHSSRSTISYSFFRDCSRTSGNVDNVSSINWLGQGADHYSHHNVIWWSSYSDNINGSCWFNKHGVNLANTGPNGHRVTYSYCINPRVAIRWHGSGLRAKGIFAYNDGAGNDIGSSIQSILWLDDGGHSSKHEDNRIQLSTFINFSQLYWRNPTYTGAPSLKTDHLIIIDNDAAYVGGNNEGVMSIDPNGTDANSILMQNYLQSNDNIFYNAAAALNFSYFRETPNGAAGGDHSFATWKATDLQDTSGSYVEDPAHSTLYVPSSINSAGKGWTSATEPAAAAVSISLPSIFPR